MIDDPYNLTVQKMPDIVSPQWTDIRDQGALAHMRRLKEDAERRFQQMCSEPAPIDPLTQASNRIRELESKVRQLEEQNAILTAELAKGSPHLHKVEKRS